MVDHGSWEAAAAAETEVTLTVEAGAVRRWRHRQWWQGKHHDNNDGDDWRQRLRHRLGITSLLTNATGTVTTITATTTQTLMTMTIMTTAAATRGGTVAVLKTEPEASAAAVATEGQTTINKEQQKRWRRQ
jgi:hypothetical protein